MRRRVLLLTEAQWYVVSNALRYIDVAFVPDEQGEGEGDIMRQQAEASRSVLKIVDAAPRRDITADASALADVFGVAVASSCSCISVRRLKGAHARDCTVTTHRGALDRVEALRKLLTNTRDQ